MIARIKQLEIFNGSIIGARERVESEKAYLRSVLRDRDSLVAKQITGEVSEGEGAQVQVQTFASTVCV